LPVLDGQVWGRRRDVPLADLSGRDGGRRTPGATRPVHGAGICASGTA